jgi:two-component system chemotaxis response regulator CheB
MNDFERPAALSCPECGGALRLIVNDQSRQYRCHVGHRFGAQEILEFQSEGVEKDIYVALRMLNEAGRICSPDDRDLSRCTPRQ